MKVYNLSCPLDHRFEGWFSSEEDCLSQQEKGILACPICDSAEITRMPSAPHIAKLSTSKEVAVRQNETVKSALIGADGGAISGDVVAVTTDDHAQLEARVQSAFL